ncbi:FAD binding domain-containing protein [Streptomyces himalayensis]|uniref:Xanthine dehydrogenase family protein subunit M n=1 Tax=Streptomyces himalayensis subsp. himalayensis TaxID=2756131 RepID=A0A7W0IBR6_9ACTN|nr:xanthine dehydrogenase family protein subunit M [Streptomyces himalayensis]MBA2949652.1 xanthine dehydrogenase family protein subunit M [Streptomyces himalayensis subsp. himalayensis]
MHPFEYARATDADQAVAVVSADPHTSFLAGGTTQLDLMKDGVLHPERLIDITRLPLGGITHTASAIRVGALTTMEELATDPVVGERLPFVRQALLLGASTQLRNMATIGGNLLQRARCRYFRDPTVASCNKRNPGSGCAAITGIQRMHAILGTSDHCIALHASDVAVPLTALDAIVHVLGAEGSRSIPLTQFYLPPGDTPHIENVLRHGELITAIEIPLLPDGARSHYLKVRDRVSYEFALASAGVALATEDGLIQEARVALGGVGTIPWRAWNAEDVLRGARAGADSFRTAAEAALEGARPLPGTAFKVELAKRTLVRTLETVAGALS